MRELVKMMDWNDGWGGGQWVAMALVMLVFWGVLVAAVVAIARSGVGHAPDRMQDPDDEAERILAQRFARGEIDSDEFTRSRGLLRSR